MDIREWLDQTAHRAPPDQTGDPIIPDFLQPTVGDKDRPGRSYRHKRNRASSDSSLIVPRPAKYRRSQAPARLQSPDHVHDAAATVRDNIGKSESSPSSRVTPADQPVEKYERRARHKTRPDRYDPKAGKRKKERDGRKDRKTEPKRRKSHRSGDGGRTAGRVQSFQLKNGPKNNRLTLKPDTSGGLFKHGRASVQMTGRGAGLPDLVFNEMRFLQHPKEHQNETADTEAPRQSKQQERRRSKEEEISAYFGANKVAVEQQRAPEKHRGQRHDERDDHDAALRAEHPKHVQPAVELPEKPFLGFASRGVGPDRRNSHDGSATCYTWSESGPRDQIAARGRSPAVSMRGAGPRMSTRRCEEHLAPANPPRRSRTQQHHSTVPQSADENTEAGKWIQTRCARGPAPVEVYQPPTTRRTHEDNSYTSPTKTTLQSLPRHHSSDHNQHRHQLDRTNDENEEDRAYRTSDILKVRDPYRESVEQRIDREPQFVSDVQEDKENRHPHSSLPIDRALGNARDAALWPRGQPTQFLMHRNRLREESADLRSHTQGYRAGRIAGAYEEPPDRPAYASQEREHGVRGANQGFPPPSVHHTPDNVELYRPQQLHAVTMDQRSLLTFGEHTNIVGDGHDDDEEMLDNVLGFQPPLLSDQCVHADRRQAEELAFRTTPVPAAGIFEAQTERSGQEPSFQWPESTAEYDEAVTIPRRSIEQESVLQSEPVAGAQKEVEDDLVGFWKPYRLY